MNLKEAKIMLEKINRLYESMIIDSKMDPFEQELMLSYIKKLYVAFSLDGEPMNITAHKRTIQQPPVATPPPAPKPPPVKREPPKIITPPQITTPPPPKKDPEVEIIEESVPKVSQPKAAPAPARKAAAPSAKSAKVSEEVTELFEDNSGKELSDKLASLPIKDLTKAMGLNERILTVNELFGKDQQAFVSAMTAMNGMANFDEAKSFLAGCAEKYNWTTKSRKKKAQVFIKLVRRRFK